MTRGSDIIRTRCRLSAGQFTLDVADAELAGLVERGAVVVIPAWPADTVLAYRQQARDWMARRPPLPHGRSASVPGISFHRRDDEHCEALIPHVFHQLALCELSHDDPGFWRSSVELVTPLLALQNRLAGTALSLSDPALKIKVINHPMGGGSFARHVHPLEPMRVAFFLGLSRPGTDYRDGGLYVAPGDRYLPLQPLIGPGDAVLFRYDLPHGIDPVDPGVERDWSGETGLWLLSAELTSSYPATRQA